MAGCYLLVRQLSMSKKRSHDQLKSTLVSSTITHPVLPLCPDRTHLVLPSKAPYCFSLQHGRCAGSKPIQPRMCGVSSLRRRSVAAPARLERPSEAHLTPRSAAPDSSPAVSFCSLRERCHGASQKSASQPQVRVNPPLRFQGRTDFYFILCGRQFDQERTAGGQRCHGRMPGRMPKNSSAFPESRTHAELHSGCKPFTSPVYVHCSCSHSIQQDPSQRWTPHKS